MRFTQCAYLCLLILPLVNSYSTDVSLFGAAAVICLSQLVDRLDYGAFSTSAAGTMSYQGLYKLVSKALYRTHVEGKLKREIIQVRTRL
jgi:hypothetical protein